ncbi:hypothetical protein V2S66_05105 [Streptomyces sp. V4-01]|uniref:Transcriptional regulator n=1 Tax=Actinacidiphila polyblastidii TaxID=3110430 RepID=A0ABU7P699_9ACTN|nr:hypothetical protein [Streptomyces sp. V4-01]
MRAALWLVAEIGEGKTFTKTQLRGAFPDVASIERRVRDLREYGWQIETFHSNAHLGPNEFLFAAAGTQVWDPLARAMHPREADLAIRQRSTTALRMAVTPTEAWDRLQRLSVTERALVLGWMAMDRRPSSPAELAWRAYRSLSASARHDLMAKLGELVSADSDADPSASESEGTAP